MRNWTSNPADTLVSENQWQEIGTVLRLSNRESEVCRHLFRGLNRREVGELLELKSSTIRQYVEQIHIKLGVKSRIELGLRIIQVRDHLLQKKNGHHLFDSASAHPE